MSTQRKLGAWLNLAWHFAKHVVTRLPLRPFRHGRDLARYNAAIAPEGFVPLTNAQRAAFPQFMNCVHCGLCSLACRDLRERPASAWEEPWTFAGGASRSLDRIPLIAGQLPPCSTRPEAAAVCPTGVPIPKMANMMKQLLILLLAAGPVMAQTQPRPRARDAGVIVGTMQPGPLNAITDVAGVRVGQVTITDGDAVRTGVTAILQHPGNPFLERVPAAVHIANAYGKLVGATQVQELGELETPILLTCTLCVWRAADAMVEWLIKQPGMQDVRSINPVVGETNDGGLNDIRARPLRPEHVVRALESASNGPVEEGSVGAGTGTIAFGWQGGIGTSARVLSPSTVGVLVQTNYGGSLVINGAPVGRELQARGQRGTGDGSIMIVVATDAPLDARNLERLAARAITGLARTGSSMSNGSGDFVIAFSTAESVRRKAPQAGQPRNIQDLPNDYMSNLFRAVAEATEEAIYNSMFKATTVKSSSMTVEALPIEATLEILRKYNAVK
ncbi:MAG TPA: P1 family peptidase [Longimicrobiales bacterium]